MSTTTAPAPHGPWNPGIQSQIPSTLLELATLYRPEHSRAALGEMREVADWFRTAADGVVEQAGRVPPNALTPDQKKALFRQLAARLEDAQRAAEQAAKDSPPHAQPALRSIADTARDGQTKLRAIAAREGA